MISHLYALKNELPVLALLPISRSRLRWERDALKPPEVICDRAAANATKEHVFTNRTVDFTLSQVLIAQFTIVEIKRIKERIEEWSRQDERIRQLLRGQELLNHRQRSIIARAPCSPDSTFSISYHKNNHNVAYATARHDLLDLVERGYLRAEEVGRAFVFYPNDNLVNRVEAYDNR